jgi:predicted glycoside hydrolase/deacetylase ChbG (UPF0249 family)
MFARKRLVINADDFGFTHDVNEGIVEAHRDGILSSTTLMANGEAFDHAVSLAERNPSLDVGCHLVLVGGNSLLPPYRALPQSVPELLGAIVSRQLRLYDELAAQVKRIVNAGIAATHIDTHKHTHLAPPVLDAVARVAQDFEIPWVRRPFDIPLGAVRGAAPWLTRMTNDGMSFLRKRFQRVLKQHGCLSTDYFAGFQLTGRFRTEELVRMIHELPDGITEFMCHPGRCGSELRHAHTRLKQSREDELAALISPQPRQALTECGVQLVNYRIL